MTRSEGIDRMFKGMKEGALPYQIMIMPFTGDFLLDLKNGLYLGTLKNKGGTFYAEG